MYTCSTDSVSHLRHWYSVMLSKFIIEMHTNKYMTSYHTLLRTAIIIRKRVKDSTDFIKKIKHLSINPEEETLVSFDVSALLTNIPVPVALQVINSKLLPAPVSPMFARSLQTNSSSFWNSLAPTASSASTRNSVNNYRVQP